MQVTHHLTDDHRPKAWCDANVILLIDGALDSHFPMPDSKSRFQLVFWLAMAYQTLLRVSSTMRSGTGNVTQREQVWEDLEIVRVALQVSVDFTVANGKTANSEDVPISPVQTANPALDPVTSCIMLAYHSGALPDDFLDVLKAGTDFRVKFKADKDGEPLFLGSIGFGPDGEDKAPWVATAIRNNLLRLSSHLLRVHPTLIVTRGNTAHDNYVAVSDLVRNIVCADEQRK